MSKVHQGSCHCGAVKFEGEMDLSSVIHCTCSICYKQNRYGTYVKPLSSFKVQGEDNLSEYMFNTKSGHHKFCKTCGTYVFCRGNVPSMGGEFVSVNIHALDNVDLTGTKATFLNGRDNTWSFIKTETL